MSASFYREVGRAYELLVFYGRHDAANAVRGALSEVTRLREALQAAHEALQHEATKLDVEATYWVPGSSVAGRNPYAHQMHTVLARSAARLRCAPTPNDEASFNPEQP
jgi:hypothetical protein